MQNFNKKSIFIGIGNKFNNNRYKRFDSMTEK